MFNVSISVKEKNILGKLIVDSYFFDRDKYEFAFYLFKDGQKEKLYARWYEDNMEVIFSIKDMSEVFYIRCFIRDKEIRNIRTFDSEKLSIDNCYDK